MSLISEALKKAQREKSNAVRGTFQGNSSRIKISDAPPNPKLFWGLLIGGTLIGTLLILLFIVLLQPGREPESERQLGSLVAKSPKGVERSAFGEVTIVQTTDLAEKPLTEILQPEALATAINEQTEDLFAMNTEPMGVLKKAPAPTPENQPVEGKATLDSVPVLTKSEDKKEQSNTINEREAQEVQIENYIRDLDISGVMIAGENSKVLLNNQVYSIYSYISYHMPLKIVEVTPQEIVFIDESGTEYRREL